jgi:hypothetical protein
MAKHENGFHAEEIIKILVKGLHVEKVGNVCEVIKVEKNL